MLIDLQKRQIMEFLDTVCLLWANTDVWSCPKPAKAFLGVQGLTSWDDIKGWLRAGGTSIDYYIQYIFNIFITFTKYRFRCCR
jgi:hypothetical protein